MRPSTDTSLPARTPVLLGADNDFLDWRTFASVMCFLEGWPLIYASVHSAPELLFPPTSQSWDVNHCSQLLAMLCRLAAGLTLIGLADALRCRRDTLTTWFLSVAAALLALGAVFCIPLMPWWIAGYHEYISHGGSPMCLLLAVFRLAISPLVQSLPCLLMVGFVYFLMIDERRGAQLLAPGSMYLAAMWVGGCALSLFFGDGRHCWEYHGIIRNGILRPPIILLVYMTEACLAITAPVFIGLVFRRKLAFVGLSLILVIGTFSLGSSLWYGPLDLSRPIPPSARIQSVFEILMVRSASHYIPWLLIWLMVGRELLANRWPRLAARSDPRCGSCAYNLHGLSGWHRCPECGSYLTWPRVKKSLTAGAALPARRATAMSHRRRSPWFT